MRPGSVDGEMMPEYDVAYVETPIAEDRAQTTDRMRAVCARHAEDGWHLVSTAPDTREGTTIGVWLYFVRDEEYDSVAAIEIAEEIISDSAG